MDKNMGPQKFCVYFMSGFLSSFLAPSTSQYVGTSFLIDLVDYENIINLDWCTFVADYLIAGITAYKNGKKKRLAGCLHLLHVSSLQKLWFCRFRFVPYIYTNSITCHTLTIKFDPFVPVISSHWFPIVHKN